MCEEAGAAVTVVQHNAPVREARAKRREMWV